MFPSLFQLASVNEGTTGNCPPCVADKPQHLNDLNLLNAASSHLACNQLMDVCLPIVDRDGSYPAAER